MTSPVDVKPSQSEGGSREIQSIIDAVVAGYVYILIRIGALWVSIIWNTIRQLVQQVPALEQIVHHYHAECQVFPNGGRSIGMS
ncbi:hypothetical protein AFLA_010599 [Aspergillus flavus NRRL3357]|nr:hypothetical protein AFLA_010599 [Aspergillus flavus NRRL3357]